MTGSLSDLKKNLNSMLNKKKTPQKKFSLNDFKTHTKAIQSKEALQAITGGIEDACHPQFSRFHLKTGEE